MISVITVTRNNADCIQPCLDTVSGQAFRGEHIVVDGGSSDGTTEMIANYVNRLALASGGWRAKWISETDKGIYDAMNKGIAMASGDVIGTLNADDYYADKDALSRVAEAFSDPSVDACYGDLVFVNVPDGQTIHTVSGENGTETFHASDETVIRRWRAGSHSRLSFYNGWMPPHPTFFVRRSLYERYGKFRLDMGTSADYEFMLRVLLKHRAKCVYIPTVQVKMRVGGVSTRSLRNRINAHVNDWRAWFVNGLVPMPWTVPMKPLRKIGQWMR